MARMENEGQRGFTLVELMIVVSIIGILASVAIPSFINYQLTSKRAEAFANLSTLAKAQKSYHAEFSTYVSVPAEPSVATGIGPTTIKRDNTGVGVAFAAVGWEPDGNVFFDYDTVTDLQPIGANCGCTDCFTAAAYGDLDGDNQLSILIVAHPDDAGRFCETPPYGQTQSPPINAGGRVFDQVVRTTVEKF